jgi:hypothetical protein
MSAVFGPLAGEISSTSICRGALIDETHAALRVWDLSASRVENFRALQLGAAIRATTGGWQIDIVSALSRRFDPGGRDLPLTLLAKGDCAFDVWRAILLWHLTRNEFQVRDFLINFLWHKFGEGMSRITPDVVIPFLAEKRIQSRLRKPWKAPTLRRVASGLLQTAQEFGMLKGRNPKEFVSFHIPEAGFVYVLHALAESEPNARRIIDAEDWRMFLMDSSDVERELLRLHQFKNLRYEVAGSLAQLSLPCGTAAEYARGLTS